MESVVASGLLSLYRDAQLTDVTLRSPCGQRLPPAHRVVLAAASPYFRAMFTGGLSESRPLLSGGDPAAPPVVEVGVVPQHSTLAAIVDYIYTGHISLTLDTVNDVLSAAAALGMTSLTNMASDFILPHMDDDNCVVLFRLGSLHGVRPLMEAARARVIERFDVLISAQCEQLNELSVIELASVLSSDMLMTSCEDAVADAALGWVAAALAERAPYVEAVLGHVRVDLLTPECRQRLLECELLANEPGCRARLKDATKTRSRKRLGMFRIPLLMFVSAGTHGRNSYSLAAVDPATKTSYSVLPAHDKFSFAHKLDHHRVTCSANGDIYVSGGVYFDDYFHSNRAGALTAVSRFDMNRQVWLPVPFMLEPRCAHGFIAYGSSLLALGGKSRFPLGTPLDSVERLDLLGDEAEVANTKWKHQSPMPLDLYHHGVCTVADTVYVLGGISTSDMCMEYEVREGYIPDELVTTTCLSYRPDHDTWCILSTGLRSPRAEFGTAMSTSDNSHKLYIVGGTDGQALLHTVDVLDMKDMKWTCGPEFPDNRKAVVAGVVEGKVYVCGGVHTVTSRQTQQTRLTECRDLWSLDIRGEGAGCGWVKEARMVEAVDVYGHTMAVMNTAYLDNARDGWNDHS